MLEGQSAEMKQFSSRFGKEAQARVGRKTSLFFRAIVLELLCHAPLRTPALQPRQRVMRCPSNSTRTPRVRVLTVSAKLLKPICTGEVSERFKEHAWKACVGEILPWVQIPPSPPYLEMPIKQYYCLSIACCTALDVAPRFRTGYVVLKNFAIFLSDCVHKGIRRLILFRPSTGRKPKINES